MKETPTFNVFDLFVTEGDRFKNSNEKGFKFINRLKRHIGSLKEGTGNKKLKSSDSNMEEIEKIELFMKDFLYVDKHFKYTKVKNIRRTCICNVIIATEISKIMNSINESGDNFIKSFLYSDQQEPFFIFENSYVCSILNQLQYEKCRILMFYTEYSWIRNRVDALYTILFNPDVFEHFGLSREYRVSDFKKRFNEIISEEEKTFTNEYSTILKEVLKLDIFEHSNLNFRDLRSWCIIEDNALDSIIDWLNDLQEAIDDAYNDLQGKTGETECYEELYEFFFIDLMQCVVYFKEFKDDAEKLASLMRTGLELIDGNEFDRH